MCCWYLCGYWLLRYGWLRSYWLLWDLSRTELIYRICLDWGLGLCILVFLWYVYFWLFFFFSFYKLLRLIDRKLCLCTLGFYCYGNKFKVLLLLLLYIRRGKILRFKLIRFLAVVFLLFILCGILLIRV